MEAITIYTASEAIQIRAENDKIDHMCSRYIYFGCITILRSLCDRADFHLCLQLLCTRHNDCANAFGERVRLTHSVAHQIHLIGHSRTRISNTSSSIHITYGGYHNNADNRKLISDIQCCYSEWTE